MRPFGDMAIWPHAHLHSTPIHPLLASHRFGTDLGPARKASVIRARIFWNETERCKVWVATKGPIPTQNQALPDSAAILGRLSICRHSAHPFSDNGSCCMILRFSIVFVLFFMCCVFLHFFWTLSGQLMAIPWP